VLLGRQVEHQTLCSRRTALAQVVNDRVIVPGGTLEWSGLGQLDIVLPCARPPAVEEPVGVRLVEEIVQPQTEARRSQTIRPDLGVLSSGSPLCAPPTAGSAAG